MVESCPVVDSSHSRNTGKKVWVLENFSYWNLVTCIDGCQDILPNFPSCRDRCHLSRSFYLLCLAKGIFSPVPPYRGYFKTFSFYCYHVHLPCFILLKFHCTLSVELFQIGAFNIEIQQLNLLGYHLC